LAQVDGFVLRGQCRHDAENGGADLGQTGVDLHKNGKSSQKWQIATNGVLR
jgi:hypothetical protein